MDRLDESLGEPAPLSLDAIAALLIQLDITDAEDLIHVQRALHSLIATRERETTYPVAAWTSLSEALRNIARLVQGGTTDPHTTLAEANRALEYAMAAIEAPLTADAHDPLPPATTPAPTTPTPRAWMILPADVDLELFGDFIIEGREYLARAEVALLVLESNAHDMEAINTVLRAFHTIKGAAAFLGLEPIVHFTHGAESLLSRMRDHEIRCMGGYADLALCSVDMLKALLQVLQDASGSAPVSAPAGLDALLHVLANPEAAGISEQAADMSLLPLRRSALLAAAGPVSAAEVEAASAEQSPQPIGVARSGTRTASLQDVVKTIQTPRGMMGLEQESSVRVRTDRLDGLIDMVGELVIAHSMVTQDDIIMHGGHYALLKKVTRAGKIVRELQDLSRAMRMVPLNATFQKMRRVVRDMTHKCGKTVDFSTAGAETEIDRNMVDVLNDPLVHMVRNAVDHGIERPEERQHQGKSATGRVRLAAYHAGGNVVIELQDDGRGLNRAKIVAKAIARGLLESDKGLSDRDVFSLIFEPGFSTADEVTDISGRGVGMDVVKSSMEALKGRIDMISEPGQGTTFVLTLPLTLAITNGMLVQVGSERYIIPITDIYMSFRPEPEALSMVSGRAELVMLRGESIPLCRLHRLFEVPGAIEDPTRGLLVVVNDGTRRCALLVDELLGQQQVVAKSLGDGIGNPMGIAGAAILGDGRVGLILDPSGLATKQRAEQWRRGEARS